MISSSDRTRIRQMAREYGMPESEIRTMLAFERGETTGDMVDIRSQHSEATPARGGFFGSFLGLIAIMGGVVGR